MEEHNSKKVILPALDCRIPQWDFQDLHERVCPICSNCDSNTEHIRPDSLAVLHCKICDTFFVSPTPSQDQLLSFYAKYDSNHRREPTIRIEELSSAYENINPLEDFRIQQLSNHMAFRDSTVLDVGFGRGKFLYTLMRLGAIPYGLELDEKAIEYARALGINNVFKGSVEDLENKTRFNLIIMNDFIEHSLNPMVLLKKASNLLESDGLLMIWTPNGEITKNENQPITFRVDLEHMQYLTPASCKFTSKELNLNIVHLETLGFPNIKGINKPLSSTQSTRIQIKKVIKSIPGASILNDILNKLSNKSSSTLIDKRREGAYHLFCIMQKSA